VSQLWSYGLVRTVGKAVFFILLLLPGISPGWEVTRIIDGDTIAVVDADGARERVRLYGIDSPERWEPCWRQARDFARAMVGGKKVKLKKKGRGKYGRLLAFVLVEDQDGRLRSLNLELVRAGLARVYSNDFAPDSRRTREKYQRAEIEATAGRRGVHGGGCRD